MHLNSAIHLDHGKKLESTCKTQPQQRDFPRNGPMVTAHKGRLKSGQSHFSVFREMVAGLPRLVTGIGSCVPQISKSDDHLGYQLSSSYCPTHT